MKLKLCLLLAKALTSWKDTVYQGLFFSQPTPSSQSSISLLQPYCRNKSLQQVIIFRNTLSVFLVNPWSACEVRNMLAANLDYSGSANCDFSANSQTVRKMLFRCIESLILLQKGFRLLELHDESGFVPSMKYHSVSNFISVFKKVPSVFLCCASSLHSSLPYKDGRCTVV